MADNKTQKNKSFSPDWLVRGILTKIGDTFDKFTGRNWKPSSSLATSELIERMKKLLDSEVKVVDGTGKFVPHNIKLKMQWDKFSTDSEESLKKLENELLVAAIDHINDNRYHTYAPLKIEIKTDYFTEGVKLRASFEEFAIDEREAELRVTIPDMKVGDFMPVVSEPEPETEIVIAEFLLDGQQKSVELKFKPGQRLSIGRTKENNLSIPDKSVSKNHATLMINAQGKFLIADTGSTNGTFINGERIVYGRAFEINQGDQVKIGHVDVFFLRTPKATDFIVEEEERTETFEPLNYQTANYENNENRSEATSSQEFETGTAAAAINARPETETVSRGEIENPPLQENYSTQNDLKQSFMSEERKTEEAVARKTDAGVQLGFRDDDKN